MNVIGVLVHALPENVADVSAALSRMAGVEVHAATDDGRLVVTATDADGRFASDALMAMNHVAGVIGTSLVYHAHEPETSEEPAAAAA
jgi:nitrate reductase NapD